MENLNINSTVKFYDGQEIPLLGFGTYLLEPAETEEACLNALRTGYRHIDTAMFYGNEKQVGQAIKRFKASFKDPKDCPRIWVTTKYFPQEEDLGKVGVVYDKLVKSRDALGVDSVDLFLVHSPLTKTKENLRIIYRDFIKAKKDGVTKTIGVSNFNAEHMDIVSNVKVDGQSIAPVANQIECHPFYTREEIVAECRKRKIVVTAWGSMTQAQYLKPSADDGKSLDDAQKKIHEAIDKGYKLVDSIAHKHQKTAAQVFLRWGIQKGYMVLPKSRNADRIKENSNIFDFSLTNEDIKSMDALNLNRSVTTGRQNFDPAKTILTGP